MWAHHIGSYVAFVQYEIRVKGHLDSRWAAWFDGLSLIRADDGTTVIRGAGWELPLSPANAARARASSQGQVIVGARHANLTVLPGSATTGLQARIYTVEPTGDLTYVHAWLGEQLLVASAPGTYRDAADQPIKLDFDQERLYLFDAETRRAL